MQKKKEWFWHRKKTFITKSVSIKKKEFGKNLVRWGEEKFRIGVNVNKTEILIIGMAAEECQLMIDGLRAEQVKKIKCLSSMMNGNSDLINKTINTANKMYYALVRSFKRKRSTKTQKLILQHCICSDIVALNPCEMSFSVNG